MRRIFPSLVLSLLVFILGACAAPSPGFPRGKYGPKASSTTTPSECLARGRSAVERSDWATAYRWYARGGGWNAQGRSAGFPAPGLLSEPEESQRFLCIAGFLDATRHLVAQGIRVDADGEHPLYVSLSEASQAIAYFRNVNPHGYAGLTTAQMSALQQGIDPGPITAGIGATAHAAPPLRDPTMDTLEQVDRAPSQLQTFQSTISASAARPSSARRTGSSAEPSGSATRESMNLQQVPPISVPIEKHNPHTETARLYREAAVKYPEGDPRRLEMLKLATEEERRAAQP